MEVGVTCVLHCKNLVYCAKPGDIILTGTGYYGKVSFYVCYTWKFQENLHHSNSTFLGITGVDFTVTP